MMHEILLLNICTMRMKHEVENSYAREIAFRKKEFERNLTYLLRFEWPQDQEVNYLASSLEVTL